MRVLEHLVDHSHQRSLTRRGVEGLATVLGWGLLTLLVASSLDVPALLGVASLPTGRAQALLLLVLAAVGGGLCTGLLAWASWQLHRFRDVERRRRPADVTVEQGAAAIAVDLPTGVDLRLARVAEVDLAPDARVRRVVVHELLPADVRWEGDRLPGPRRPTGSTPGPGVPAPRAVPAHEDATTA